MRSTRWTMVSVYVRHKTQFSSVLRRIPIEECMRKISAFYARWTKAGDFCSQTEQSPRQTTVTGGTKDGTRTSVAIIENKVRDLEDQYM